MKEKTYRSVIALLVVLAMVLSLVPAGAVAQQTEKPNNAKAIVARGEEAFVKSDYDFSANWIWSPTDDGAGNRWMAFRKDVTLDAADLSGQITAKISADTKYWLWINGELAVFEGQLKRGAALLNKDIYLEGTSGQPNLSEMIQEVATYYDEVDLTPYLQEGENSIVALVWYLGNEGHSHVGSGKGGFLFESQMGDQLVLSDESWKVSRHKGYQASSGIGGYAQEYHIVYDAQAGYNDFYKPEFDVSGWEDAAVLGAAGDKPWNELWPRTIPEWKVWDLVTYTPDDTEHVAKSGTTYRIDLPTNIQFTPYIKVKAPAGKKIVISCPNAGNTSVTYTTMGGADGEAVVQEYESPAWINWWFINFDIPDDVEILELGYRQSGYNTELTGYFNSNDDYFNTLWTKARDTVYVNIRDTFMDCPDRERCPWLGDMVNEAQIAYYTMDENVFDAVRKDIAVRVNWQNSDGVIPTTAPNTFRHNEYSELTGQSLAGVMSWFTYYLYSGDRVTLEQAYPALLKYMEMFDLEDAQFTVPFARANGTNTVHQSWIDWGNNIDKDLSLNIWAYIGVKTVIDFANTLGDHETATRYEKIRDLMKSKFDQTFWNGSEYRSSTYTGPADDRGQALAVYAGLASPDKYPILKDILLENQFASPYMVKYSIEALYLMGYPEAAEQRMRESYANDVPLDDPTFSEGWGGSGTKNHGWSGGGLIALSGYAAGVRPLEAGYDKFIVKPQMGDQITSIDAGIPSIKGMICVQAEKTDEQFSLSVHVPEESEALIGIPRMKGDTAVYCGNALVWNDGELPFDVPGLSYAYSDYSHIYFNATPGDWSFTASAAEKHPADSYTLTIPALENGGVLVNGQAVSLPYEANFAAGEVVSVQAEPDEGYQFESFDGTVGSREETISLTMDSNKQVRANFVKIWEFDGFNLNVTANKPGVVTMNGREMNLPYSNALERDTEVTLMAQDTEEYVFVAWRDKNGKVISTDSTINFVMSEDHIYEAEFVSTAGENFALGKQVTVSSSVDNSMFGPQKATDGVYTVTGVNEGWTSLETSPEQWIIVDLGENRSIGTVKLFPRNNGTDDGYGIPIDLEILVSQDGENWETIYTVKDQERPLADSVTYQFDAIEARYVKVNGSKLRENPADGNRTRFQISEIEVYGEVFDSAPEILLQPESFEGAVGSSVTFSVTAQGQAPMNYQWQVSEDGGESWSDVDGANRTSYTVTAKYTMSGNQYRCVVSNPLGEAVSNVADLTVISANYALNRPSEVSSNQDVGDYFRQSYLNDGVTETQNFSNEGYTSAANTTDGVEWVVIDVGAPKSVSRVTLYPRYNGKDDGYGIPEDYNVQVSLDGETWTTVYEAAGTERPTSGPVVIDFEPVMASFVKFEGTKLRANPQDYDQKRIQIVEMEIYNVGRPAAPVLEEEPDHQTANVGDDVSFAVRASGGDELSYQWQRSVDGVNFTDIEGAIGSELHFIAQKADHGSYFRCVLTDEFGRTETRAARLYLIGNQVLSDNYALNRPVEASSTMGESKYGKEKLVDGVTEHAEGVNHGWMGDNTQYDKDHVEWVAIDMQEQRSINTIRIFPIVGDSALQGYGMPVNMNIYVSDDGQEWTLLQEYRDIPVPELYTDFAIPETTTRFVKVEGVNLRQNPNNGNSYRMAFAELEIYEVTTNLLPIISLQPEDITVQAGDTASFAVTAEEGCTYQWQRLEGDAWINLDGAVESTLVLPAHLTESGTQFRCIVTGVGGTIESQEATLTVTPREMTVEASVDGEKVESVIVQQYFTVTVRSDANVKNVRILNENGLSMGRKDYQVTTDQNGTVITMQMNIGTVGDGRSLSIFVQTEEGGAYVDSGVKLTLDVMSVAPQVLSVQAPDTMVVNRASDVVAVTSQEAEKVTIYNEYGLPVITVRNYQDTEDGRAFVIPLKVGTAGTRQFTVVAVNRYGAESQAAPFGPITVRYF